MMPTRAFDFDAMIVAAIIYAIDTATLPMLDALLLRCFMIRHCRYAAMLTRLLAADCRHMLLR